MIDFSIGSTAFLITTISASLLVLIGIVLGLVFGLKHAGGVPRQRGLGVSQPKSSPSSMVLVPFPAKASVARPVNNGPAVGVPGVATGVPGVATGVPGVATGVLGVALGVPGGKKNSGLRQSKEAEQVPQFLLSSVVVEEYAEKRSVALSLAEGSADLNTLNAQARKHVINLLAYFAQEGKQEALKDQSASLVQYLDLVYQACADLREDHEQALSNRTDLDAHVAMLYPKLEDEYRGELIRIMFSPLEPVVALCDVEEDRFTAFEDRFGVLMALSKDEKSQDVLHQFVQCCMGCCYLGREERVSVNVWEKAPHREAMAAAYMEPIAGIYKKAGVEAQGQIKSWLPYLVIRHPRFLGDAVKNARDGLHQYQKQADFVLQEVIKVIATIGPDCSEVIKACMSGQSVFAKYQPKQNGVASGPLKSFNVPIFPDQYRKHMAKIALLFFPTDVYLTLMSNIGKSFEYRFLFRMDEALYVKEVKGLWEQDASPTDILRMKVFSIICRKGRSLSGDLLSWAIQFWGDFFRDGQFKPQSGKFGFTCKLKAYPDTRASVLPVASHWLDKEKGTAVLQQVIADRYSVSQDRDERRKIISLASSKGFYDLLS